MGCKELHGLAPGNHKLGFVRVSSIMNGQLVGSFEKIFISVKGQFLELLLGSCIGFAKVQIGLK